MQIARLFEQSKISGENMQRIIDYVAELENKVKAFDEGRTEIVVERMYQDSGTFGYYQPVKTCNVTPEVAKDEILKSFQLKLDTLQTEYDNYKNKVKNKTLIQRILNR